MRPAFWSLEVATAISITSAERRTSSGGFVGLLNGHPTNDGCMEYGRELQEQCKCDALLSPGQMIPLQSRT
ncbi:hypothetical protein V9T40_005714 [Parthenolecanium corni]|uniref:Uncharacterized protein n=1 Tax=Parthenolecanium corni TaxID=536013 RepID=A0AAN9TUQ3_9HEMI